LKIGSSLLARTNMTSRQWRWAIGKESGKEVVILALAIGLCACGGASEAAKDGGATSSGSGATKPAASSNPWGGFKVGSYVKMKTTVSTEVMGKAMDTSTETKTTLAALTSDKAVLDIEATVMGNTSKTRTEVPLSGTGAPGVPAASTTGQAQNIKSGTDTITVAGKSLDCKTTEAEVDSGGNKVTTKPGCRIKCPGSWLRA